MMAKPGSCERAKAIALKALLEQGCTPLEAKIGAHVASYGKENWQIDRVVAEILAQDYGHAYHRESIGRARRSLARGGFIRVKRLFPGQKSQAMKRSSAHGTTVKSLRWDVLHLKNPYSRMQRRLEHAMQVEKEAAKEPKREPRYSSIVALAPEPVQPDLSADPELNSVIREFIASQELRFRQPGPIEAKPSTSGNERAPPTSR